MLFFVVNRILGADKAMHAHVAKVRFSRKLVPDPHFPPSDGENSDGDKDGEDRAEEDVLSVQAREAEQAAVDVSGSLLGSLVSLLSREIVREAVSASAAAKVNQRDKKHLPPDRGRGHKRFLQTVPLLAPTKKCRP